LNEYILFCIAFSVLLVDLSDLILVNESLLLMSEL